MSFTEQRAMLAKELEDLVDHVKAGDADAIKRADEIVAELDQVDEHLARAAEKAARLQGLAETRNEFETKEGSKMETKTIGQLAVEAVEASGIKRGSVPGKAATDTIVSPNPGEVEIQDRVVAVPNGRLWVRDLFSYETANAPVVGFFTLSTEGDADTVAEDGAKPQLSASAELTTVPLKKVAGIMKTSDEMLEDYPRLVSAINGRGVYLKDLAVEDQLINGTGTGADITGLLAAGISTDTYANGADAQAQAEAIFAAAMSIEGATGLAADAVIMNPQDFAAIRLAKDGNDQYFGGGFFQNSYGNAGEVRFVPELWGLSVALSTYVSQGTYIVGAFRAGATVVGKGGTRVEVGYDGTDFSHDRVTTRIEERIALEVFVPEAFVELTEAGA